MDEGFVFDERSMRLLVTMYRDLQRRFANLERRLDAEVSRQTSDWKPAKMYVCKTDTAIDAMAGDVAGFGTVTVYELDDLGTLTATTKDITAYNIASSEVAADTYIQVKEELATHRYVIDFEDCGA
jgi:hypothetical protein